MAKVYTSGFYSLTKACAFWDIEDFPVPVGGDLNSFRENLREALYDGTFREAPLVKAYSAVQTRDVNDRYRAADIPIEYQENDKRTRLTKMLLDIDLWARKQPTSEEDMGEKTNVLVIAKNVSDEDSLFAPLLKELDAMHYEVSLVVPDEQPLLPKEVLSIPPVYVRTWGTLFRGGSHIEDEDYYEGVSPNDTELD